MKITVDDVIAFGYFRKWYNEMKKDYITINAFPKDYINKVVDYHQDNSLREPMLKHNKRIEMEADSYAREVIQISVDNFNDLEYNLEYIRKEYKNG